MFDSSDSCIKRLIASIASQWLLILTFFVGYYWSNHILPEKIMDFYGLLQENRVTSLPDQSGDFLRSLTSFPDFKTLASYLASLLSQAGNWGYVNLTLIFARLTRFVCVGVCNIVLLYLALNIFFNIIKTYKQKTHLHESVQMIVEALLPQLENMDMEIRHLRSEVKMLKHELQSR